MKDKKPILYAILKPIVMVLVKVLYRPTYINAQYIPTSGPIIISGNHIHAFDAILTALVTKRVVYFLAKGELFKWPLSWILNGVGAIPVDRTKRDKSATDKAQEYLNEGKALSILPEGTRNRTKELLLPFKYGAVSLAQKTGALIVPFAIVGRYKLFRKSVTVVFEKPFKVKDTMELEEANQKLRTIIKNILESGSKK